MKLFVGRLSYDATDDDLREAFEPLGEVLSARVITDRDSGRSRGFGFVEMENSEDGNKAISELDGQPICGRPVVVNEAHEKRGGR